MEYKIVAGLVGGDMNLIDKSEHEFHKRDDIDLKDVWEDVPAPPISKLRPFQKDLTYGRVRGNTYGYQSDKNRERKRLDKFFYTGSLETVPFSEIHDVTGKLGRLGIGLKTEVDAWEWTLLPWTVKGGKFLNKPVKEYRPLYTLADERVQYYLERKELLQIKHECWVSDHFGIAVGVKVPLA
jgi:tyrosyl-DNA phosphodiesterase 2